MVAPLGCLMLEKPQVFNLLDVEIQMATELISVSMKIEGRG